MNSSRSVDVVIPCYNGARFIDRCIKSVLAQTSPVNRIIFVDDGSTDNSLALILKLQEEFSNIQVITQDNQGLAAARNKGISFSEATFLSFLDVDDYWLPTKIENQIDLIESGPKDYRVAIASNYFDEDSSSRRPGITNHSGKLISPESLLTYRCVVPGSGSSALIPRRILDHVGFFDEGLRYGEDLDLWIRIAQDFQWLISAERDVVIYSNPDGIQARKMDAVNAFERDTIKILDRYRKYLSNITYFVMKSYIYSISIRGRGSLRSIALRDYLHLTVGLLYSVSIKVDRKYL
jgi:glycosyltransferase involved in cell wall biosynthesis